MYPGFVGAASSRDNIFAPSIVIPRSNNKHVIATGLMDKRNRSL